jgi:S1-C subfamily serine protease
MNSKSVLVLIILSLAIFSAGLLASPIILFRESPSTNGPTTPVSSTQTVTITTVVATKTVTTTLSGENALTPVDLFKKVQGSVVSILVNTAGGTAQGSGFVYDGRGHIVTNNHVVEGAQSISVTFLDGASVDAQLVGTDVYGDLAVIVIQDSSRGMQPIPLGDSNAIQVGEPVAAIGNPFGLSGTMTLGIVSQLGRSTQAVGGYLMIDLIQTDAAVNPGNSGGPLLNMQGEVVGVNTLIFSNSGVNEGVGLSIPSNTIRRIADSLISTGTYTHPWVGVQGMDVVPIVATAMNLPAAKGFLVLQVIPDSPAAKAGIKESDQQTTVGGQTVAIGGDVIVGIDNVDARNLNDLLLYTERNKSPGDTVTLKIIRGDETVSVDLVLGERPPP